ncbi:MAG TPA: hypothetical protein PK954_04870, partial [Anaerolineales bacterium]|nr:hypothetical protein [Anaerolineales bacterium]
MSTPSQGSGCLLTGINLIAALMRAILTTIVGLLAALYQIFLAGFKFEQIRNKSGFVLFWV